MEGWYVAGMSAADFWVGIGALILTHCFLGYCVERAILRQARQIADAIDRLGRKTDR